MLFSPNQVQVLEDKFRMSKYLNAADREALANRISLSATQVLCNSCQFDCFHSVPVQVKIWFQNQRYKHKRQDRERKMDGVRGSNSEDRDSDTDRDDGSLVCSPSIKKEELDDQKPFMASPVSCLPDIQQHSLPYQVGFRLNGEPKKEEPAADQHVSCLPDFSQQPFYQVGFSKFVQ